MRLQKSWPFLVYFSFFVLLVAAAVACGPPVGIGNENDGNSQSEGGSNTEGLTSESTPESVTTEPTAPDASTESTSPDATAESITPDATAESITPDATTESTSPDATTESTSPDATPDVLADTTPESTGDTTPESTGEAIPEGQTRCEQQGGYCELFPNSCKADYQTNGDPLDCPGGRSAACCTPVPPPPQCTNDKECPPTCKGSGVCEQYEYKCIAGLCVAGPPLTQPNASCEAATGQCAPLTAGCKTNCDCAQGLMCTNNRCVAGTKPAYCCTQKGCPVGESCQNTDGSNGTCPATQTDCAQKGGQCIPQNTNCPSGTYLNTTVACGTIRALLCCLPNPCATIKCQGPTCATTSSGTCSATLYTCDPNLGQCVPTTKTTNPSCSMNGNTCTQSTPVCSNNQCAVKATNTPLSCRQSGTSCIQVLPACANNTCTSTTQTIANNTCDATTGKCTPTQATCKSNCDCSQGLMCANGQCIAGTVAAYCCSKAGCPAGSSCQNADGTKGTCPATQTDCAKKGGQCVTQGMTCPSGMYMNGTVSCGGALSLNCCLPNPCATIRCQGPTCATSSSGACNETTYICDPALAQCVPNTKTINSACSMSGSTCTQFTPACSNNQCAVKTATNGPSCAQSGTSCIQTIPTCSNNQCGKTSRTLANSTCNTATGQCGSTSTGCKSNCDCSQGLLCASGQCLVGIVPAYCCTKAGCPSGQSCENPDGTRGTCPAQTACAQKGGTCVTQAAACPPNHKTDSTLSCGGSLSLKCCVPII